MLLVVAKACEVNLGTKVPQALADGDEVVEELLRASQGICACTRTCIYTCSAAAAAAVAAPWAVVGRADAEIRRLGIGVENLGHDKADHG